jgi:hypothetical protein
MNKTKRIKNVADFKRLVNSEGEIKALRKLTRQKENDSRAIDRLIKKQRAASSTNK